MSEWTGSFRLIFKVNEENKVVYLVALDHRGEVYHLR